MEIEDGLAVGGDLETAVAREQRSGKRFWNRFNRWQALIGYVLVFAMAFFGVLWLLPLDVSVLEIVTAVVGWVVGW